MGWGGYRVVGWSDTVFEEKNRYSSCCTKLFHLFKSHFCTSQGFRKAFKQITLSQTLNFAPFVASESPILSLSLKIRMATQM